MSNKKIIEQYVQMAVAMEAVLQTTRDSIFHEITLNKKNDLKTVESQMQFSTKKDKKKFLEIKKGILEKINKYKSLQKKNNSSKDITRLFCQVNDMTQKDDIELFIEKSQDLYAEFAELLYEMYSLDYVPKAHSAILIEHPEGDCDFEGKKYKCMVKKM